MNLIKFCTTYSIDPVELRRRCFYSPMGTNNIVSMISNGEVKKASFSEIKNLNPKDVEKVLNIVKHNNMTILKTLERPKSLPDFIDILLPCGTYIKNVDSSNDIWDIVVAYL